MKRSNKSIKIVIAIFVLVGFVSYILAHQYAESKDTLRRVIVPSGKGKVMETLAIFDSIEYLPNILYNFQYQRLKKSFKKRFENEQVAVVTLTQEPTVDSIIGIYHQYWKESLMQTQRQNKLDSSLIDHLKIFLANNHLVPDSSKLNIFEKLVNVIEEKGFYSSMNQRWNGIKGMAIWKEQTSENYTIKLPEDTLTVKVNFMNEMIVNGVRSFASMGKLSFGGWSDSKNNQIYCSQSAYDLESEKFKYSYLKHEGQHIVDGEKYPKIITSSKEYRAKLAELSYLNKTLFDRLGEFLVHIEKENDRLSHSYANYQITSKMSQILFDKDFEEDLEQWKSIPVKKINEIAVQLLVSHSEELNN